VESLEAGPICEWQRPMSGPDLNHKPSQAAVHADKGPSQDDEKSSTKQPSYRLVSVCLVKKLLG